MLTMGPTRAGNYSIGNTGNIGAQRAQPLFQQSGLIQWPTRDQEIHAEARDWIEHLRDPRQSGAAWMQFKPPQTIRSAEKLFGPDSIIEKKPIREWFAEYSASLWSSKSNRPAAGAPHEKIRQSLIRALGGAHSERGREMSRRFDAINIYLRDLRNAERRQSMTAPQHSAIIADKVEMMKNNAVGSIGNGLSMNNPDGTLQYHLQPRLAAADRAVETTVAPVNPVIQADEVIAQKIREIENFWNRQISDSTEYIRYTVTGELVFDTIADMERYCPPGDYPDPRPSTFPLLARPKPFSYAGKVLREVFLQEDGRERRVVFRGATWLYADQERPADRMPQVKITQANPQSHSNRYWDNDPRVVNARISGSVNTGPTDA